MSGIVLLILRILLVIALYAFLGWALLTLWRDLKRQGSQFIQRKPPAVTLLYQFADETHSLRFNLPDVTIGRDPASDFSIDDKTVSAKHARLAFRQGQWWVEDLQSTNGTYLNDEPVSSPLVVTSGDQIRCGQVLLDIAIGESEKN
jgi:pSer/pThr/pTyr-binding forkhead associated (FHA) protein